MNDLNNIFAFLDNEADRMRRVCQAARQIYPLLDDLPFEVELFQVAFRADIPRSAEAIRQVHRLLVENGWRREDIREREFDIAYRYEKDGLGLDIIASPSVAGSTCRMVQVGVEKVEQPVYRMECDE